MTMTEPVSLKIYHIVHVDRLESIVSDGYLWCDTTVVKQESTGTSIGIIDIKRRRATNRLKSHDGLHVGDCVPFYFCPRSVMLYVIYRANHPAIMYRGGQSLIVHLEADFADVIAWANRNDCRWAFTSSNAGSGYFEDYCNESELNMINWSAVQAEDWRECMEEKQAEFLIEKRLPWTLVQRVGVENQRVMKQVLEAMRFTSHHPKIEIKSDWYY